MPSFPISGLNQVKLIGKETTQLSGFLGHRNLWLAQGVVCGCLLWKRQGMERTGGEAGSAHDKHTSPNLSVPGKGQALRHLIDSGFFVA